MGEAIVWPSRADVPRQQWLWRESIDLLLVGGVGSMLFFAVLVPATIAAPELNPLVVTAFLHLGVVVNYPHYSATYDLIATEGNRHHQAWLLGSTIAILGLTGAAIANPAFLLIPIVQLYLTWSAYHYAAQNFGIAAMYSARGGAPLDGAEKWLLWTSTTLVAALMMIRINIGGSYGVPGASEDFADVANLVAVFPMWLFTVGWLLAGIGVALMAVLHVRFKARTGQNLDKMVWLLWATNFLWLAGSNVWLPWHDAPLLSMQGIVWVAFAVPFFHCLQYLAVAADRMRAKQAIRPIYVLTRLVAVGLALFLGVAFVIENAFGVGHTQALLLVMAVVNLHHFFLDGIVWKGPKKKRAPAPALAAK